MKVLVCGAGKMVEAILEGLQNEMDLSQFYIYSPSGVSAKNLAQKVGANWVASPQEVAQPEWVWVGCKPQQLKELGATLGGHFEHSIFVSMLAAIPESYQCQLLGIKKLIRIMPNLAVRYKSGVTLISSLSATDSLPRIRTLFSLLGLAQEVTESELEELTLLTGSGPAFFYEFAKTLSESFTSLSQTQRENLARHVLQGAAITCQKGDGKLDDLISSVTSKGGVTIAVLEKWRSSGMKELTLRGIERGKERSLELKGLYPQN